MVPARDRSSRGSPSRGSGSKIALPEIERDGRAGLGGYPPQLPPIKANVVDDLRVLTPSIRVGIGEDVGSVDPMDHALLAAGISRQASVTGRVDIHGHHSLANGEARA